MHLKMLFDMFVVGCIVRKHFLTDIELANFSPLSAVAAHHHIPKKHLQAICFDICKETLFVWNAR